MPNCAYEPVPRNVAIEHDAPWEEQYQRLPHDLKDGRLFQPTTAALTTSLTRRINPSCATPKAATASMMQAGVGLG